MAQLNRLADWLDLNDYGYPLGLASYLGFCAALIVQLWWLAVPLLLLAFFLCWYFG